MKVFLSADIEGTCGICAWPETDRATPFDYTPFQQQMTREVAAACRGALAAGALGTENYGGAVWVFAATAALSLAGVGIYRLVIARHEKKDKT